MSHLVVLALAFVTYTAPCSLAARDTTDCIADTVRASSPQRHALLGWHAGLWPPDTLAEKTGQAPCTPETLWYEDRGQPWQLAVVASIRDTAGRELWSCIRKSISHNWPVDAPTEELPRIRLGRVIPSPVVKSAQVPFWLGAQSYASLDLFDTGGRRLRTLVRGSLAAGAHVAIFNASGLEPGVYYLRLRAGRYQGTSRFVVLR